MNVHQDHEDKEEPDNDPVRELAASLTGLAEVALRQSTPPVVSCPVTVASAPVHIQPPHRPKSVHVVGTHKGNPFEYTATYYYDGPPDKP